jgi:hypothetical protein
MVNNKKNQNVAIVPDYGKIYVKRNEKGELMKPVRANVTLTTEKNQLYKVGSNWQPTAAAYNYLNKIASVSIVRPNSVIVDGEEKSNPFITRNPQTKIIESVFIRKMGIGYSASGNIVVIDKTLYYHLYTYFIESIQAKMKQVIWKSGKPTKEKKYPDLARLGKADNEELENAGWVFYPIELPVGIWLNLDDPVAQDIFAEHTQRQRFAERIADTICNRNILRDHPAIGIASVDPKEFQKKNKKQAQTNVMIFSWRNEHSVSDINDMMMKAESDDAKHGMEIKRETIVDADIDSEKDAMNIEQDKGETAPKNKEENENDDDDGELFQEKNGDKK